jgi:Lrp/AsnC family leucine-responsive transcriptional regulator
MSTPEDLDTIDRRLVAALQRDARATNVQLSARVHLSAAQCLRRVRSLEQRGVIRGYAAQVDAGRLGYAVTAYVSIAIGREESKRAREVERLINDFPEIVECHAISGDFDYMLKVVAHDLKSLSDFLTDRLLQLPGVAGVRSAICLEQIKAAAPLPVDVAG